MREMHLGRVERRGATIPLFPAHRSPVESALVRKKQFSYYITSNIVTILVVE